VTDRPVPDDLRVGLRRAKEHADRNFAEQLTLEDLDDSGS
jgi:hypothetical protein